MDLLEQDFSHFGYPNTIVSDNSSSFKSEEFQQWCKVRGIIHLTGAPYHPATNGAAERLVQSFKKALKKSTLPPKAALQEFLIQYRRTPLASGLSPSQLLNGRQIRATIDILLPSPAHIAQGKQMKCATEKNEEALQKTDSAYKVGTPCYALYYKSGGNQKPRWVPAVVTKVIGARTVNVRVHPRGPVWRRHVEQLRLRHGAEDDDDPGDIIRETCKQAGTEKSEQEPTSQQQNESVIHDSEYGPDNPRRSCRNRRPPRRLSY